MSDPLKSRKLRPLLEAFKAGNYRNVLRLSSQRDMATNTAAQVVRAQTLAIVGQRTESLEIISSIKVLHYSLFFFPPPLLHGLL